MCTSFSIVTQLHITPAMIDFKNAFYICPQLTHRFVLFVFFAVLPLGMQVQASSHYSGTRHAKRMKTVDTPDSKIRTPEPITKETASQILSSPSQPSRSDTTSEGVFLCRHTCLCMHVSVHVCVCVNTCMIVLDTWANNWKRHFPSNDFNSLMWYPSCCFGLLS